jgi:mannose-6-phosphate isomerase-like protein (cupin superfamily)
MACKTLSSPFLPGDRMKTARFTFNNDFKIMIGNKRSQAAEMVLGAHASTGGSDNRHRGSDQWLYVASGKGEAIVNGKRYPLGQGKLVLIKRGEKHEIRNLSKAPLKTLNIYVPPAYTKQGNERPAGRP